MAEKHFYNDRFQCPDPLAKTAVGRATRHRILKQRKLTESDQPVSTNIVDCSDEDCALDLSRPVDVAGAELNMDVASGTGCVSDSPSDFTGTSVELVLTESELLTEYFPQDILFDEQFNDFDVSGEKDADDCPEQSGTENEYLDSTQSEKPLFDGCPLTPSASNILLIKFKMRHNLTKEALSDLLKLIELHCPTPNRCCHSMYFFNKQFKESLKQPVYFHSFCSACFEVVELLDTKCPNLACGIGLNDHSKSSFIELPLEAQLTSVLERKGCFEILSSHYHLRNGNSSGYHDIYDGAVYQNLISTGFLSNSVNLSLMFNTDGVPVFKSSSYSFWPLHLTINELPYGTRFLKENRLLGGLWYGSSKPDMTLFLKPMAQSLTKLYKDGMLISPPGREPFTCRIALVGCTCDLPAKALVTNAVQYNGFYGCSHCLQQGKTWKVGARGRVHVFPYHVENTSGPTRTDAQNRSNAKDALSTGSPVFGVKGPSWLGIIPKFDLVRGLSCDYMHSVLLGVCRILLCLWYDSKHHKEIWYLGKQVQELDHRLCGIQPPSEIRRTPRSIENTVKFWKAHELRAWLLHYSPVVLVGYLEDDYYQHHLLLVEAVYLLLKDMVTDRDIIHSEQLFKHYVYLMSPLYGERYLTGSVHGLLHLPETVRNLGPLWAHSCFGYESANGDLLKLFHGSQGVEKQIVSHVGALQRLPELAHSSLVAGSSEECFFGQMCTINTRKDHQNVSFTCAVGNPHSEQLSESERGVFNQCGVSFPASSRVLVYQKLTIPKTNRIVAARTGRQTLRDNSCFMYSSDSGRNQYGLLKKVVVCDNGKAFAVAVSMSLAARQMCTDALTNAQLNSHLTTFNPPTDDNMTVVSLDQIVDKCVFMDLRTHTGFVYSSLFPNCKEFD